MVARVKNVEYVSEYKLKIQFANGKTKIVDLQGMLRGKKNLFLDLLDLDYFKKVECDGFSIVWPNGIDFCPDVLYNAGQDIGLKKRRRKKTLPRTAKNRKRFRAKV